MKKKDRMEKEKKIKKKSEPTSKLTLIGLIILIIAIIIVLGIYADYKIVPELTQGNSAQEFCFDKCGGEVYSSNNNSYFNFVRCECVIEIGPGSPSYTKASVPSIKTEVLFFDTTSLEELTEDEVIARIK